MPSMSIPEEILDIVDKQDQVIVQATRRETHASHLLHRAVHVLIYNSRHELLVQKRSATKDSFPGCFDSSAAGHLNADESYDAAAYRETQEELGLVLPSTALLRRLKIDACLDTGWEFVWVYTANSDALVTPDPNEVESVTAMSRGQVEALLINQPNLCARSFRLVLNEVFARGLFPASR